MAPRIAIVGLGPGSVQSLTVGAMNTLKSGAPVLIRTARHPSIAVLDDNGIDYESFDALYEQVPDYDQLYQRIADRVVAVAVDTGSAVYAVPGHPLLFEDSAQRLVDAARKAEVVVDIVHGVSFLDSILGLIPLDSGSGFTVITADGCWPKDVHELPVVIGQVSTKRTLRALKRRLLSSYDADHVVFLVTGADTGLAQRVETVAIAALDGCSVNHLSTVFVPANQCQTDQDALFTRAVRVIATLRGPDGCPWDREQTVKSLRPYVIEEAHEVVAAIEEGRWDMLCEELGDLMLEVLMLAQIAAERGEFSVSDVLTSLITKMTRRHPHVFADATVSTSDQVVAQWEEIKRREKGDDLDLFSGLPVNLPALIKAFRVQEKAAQVGFDWDRPQPVFDKIAEELQELLRAYEGNSQERIEEEVGDLLFSIVNVCRFLRVEPEMALRGAVRKFIIRFTNMEQSARSDGRRLEEMSLDEMDQLWEFCKQSDGFGKHKP